MIKYDREYHTGVQMQGMMTMFRAFAEAVAFTPDMPVRSLPRMDSAGTEAVLAMSAGPKTDLDMSGTWIDLFLSWAAKEPDRNAVSDITGSITYRELDRASDAVAMHLLAEGIGAGDFVAINMDRVKEFPVAVLGVHKAGAAYVPVDPGFPKERVEYMLEDCGAKIVLTEGSVREAAAQYPVPDPVHRAVAGSPAYMIYTSGSTGRPKGAVNTHIALYNYSLHFIRRLDITPEDRISHHFTWAVDASILDLFSALGGGAELCIMPEKIRRNPAELIRFLDQHRITGGSFVTGVTHLMLPEFDHRLRFVTAGGEALQDVRADHCRVINTYGPTEAADTVLDHELARGMYYGKVPLGRPIENVSAFILDKYGNLLPGGVAGEICTAGVNVGPGYWNQPEMTGEVFSDCPFTEGVRMYRTGDLGYYNEDGNVEFLGRIDLQVKLHGYRIETGEVEAAALSAAEIEQAAAEIRDDRLVLYYTVDPSAERIPEDEELREFLSGSLPEYMIPAVYMRLDEMPVSPSGKVDRRALPEPEREPNEMVPPGTDREKALIRIASRILGTDHFGVTDDLERLGLNSILSMRFALQSEQAGTNIKVNDIMRYRTIRRIAASAAQPGYWASEYGRGKPVAVLIQGVSSHDEVRLLISGLAERGFAVYVIEPVYDHFGEMSVSSTEELALRYTELLDGILPAEADVRLFIGHSYGGKLAYLCAGRWETMRGEQSRIVMLDTHLYAEDEPLLRTEKRQDDGKTASQENDSYVETDHIWSMLDQLEKDRPDPPYYGGAVLLIRAMLQDEIQGVVIRPEDFERVTEDSEMIWRRIVPQIQVLRLAARHYTMAGTEHVSAILDAIEHFDHDLEGRPDV